MPRVMKTKFPATVMIFGVVSNDDNIMPPHIFEVSLKVNTKVYLDLLKSVVIPWCTQVAGGRPWVWLQNSALAHKSKEIQAWLQKECYDFAPFSHWPTFSSPEACPRGVMVKAMNCGIVVRDFILQSRYYVHFWANTLGKGMNPLILPPAMGK